MFVQGMECLCLDGVDGGFVSLCAVGDGGFGCCSFRYGEGASEAERGGLHLVALPPACDDGVVEGHPLQDDQEVPRELGVSAHFGAPDRRHLHVSHCLLAFVFFLHCMSFW